MADNEDTGAAGQRVTVHFNPEDLSRVTGEVDRRTAERGYKVARADVLRDLVREHWPVPVPQ